MPHQSTSLVATKEWLADFITNHSRIERDILRAAYAARLGDEMVLRARRLLGIKLGASENVGTGELTRYWVLPTSPTTPQRTALSARPGSWRHTRQIVWARDGGCCDVCARDLNEVRDYHCGHIIDRAIGGSDEPDNLTVMCSACNLRKPRTIACRADYITWRTTYTQSLVKEACS